MISKVSYWLLIRNRQIFSIYLLFIDIELLMNILEVIEVIIWKLSEEIIFMFWY